MPALRRRGSHPDCRCLPIQIAALHPYGTRRTDRTEDVGGGMAVVANRCRTGATRRPQIGQRALLADARLVPGLRRGRLVWGLLVSRAKRSRRRSVLVGWARYGQLGAGRSEGSSPLRRGTSRHTLVFGRSGADLDHDAVMRIGGEAPGRRAHSLRRRRSHACLGSPPPRIVIGGSPAKCRRAPKACARNSPRGGCSRSRTQDDALRDLAGRHQLP